MTYVNGAQYPNPVDPMCGRTPGEIFAYIDLAKDEGITPEAYVVREEGTYNPRNGHFLCDKCYIEAGMPTAPYGWICP